MNISEITEKVRKIEPFATQEQVSQVIESLDRDISDISDNHIPAIASKLSNKPVVQNSDLAQPQVKMTTSSGKLSTGKPAPIARKATAQTGDRTRSDNAIVNFARNVDQDLADHAEVTAAGVTSIAEYRADQVVTALKNAPDVYFNRIEAGLQEGVDRDSFRTASSELSDKLRESFPWLEQTS